MQRINLSTPAAVLHHYQPIRLRVRQGAEQDSVDKTEYGRGRPDAERQREHGHGGETRVLQQLAEGVAKVIKHNKRGPSAFRDVMEGSELRWIPARPSRIQEMVETDTRNRIPIISHGACQRPDIRNKVYK